jgi:hypothetical protein
VRAAPYESAARLALAVALDRDEQGDRARVEVQQVLKADPLLRRFRREEYLFVPPADALWYDALLARVRGRPADARKSLDAFLKAAPDSPYAARARKLLVSGL